MGKTTPKELVLFSLTSLSVLAAASTYFCTAVFSPFTVYILLMNLEISTLAVSKNNLWTAACWKTSQNPQFRSVCLNKRIKEINLLWPKDLSISEILLQCAPNLHQQVSFFFINYILTELNLIHTTEKKGNTVLQRHINFYFTSKVVRPGIFQVKACRKFHV